MKNSNDVQNNNIFPLTSEEYLQTEKITSQDVLDVINDDDVEVEQFLGGRKEGGRVIPIPFFYGLFYQVLSKLIVPSLP